MRTNDRKHMKTLRKSIKNYPYLLNRVIYRHEGLQPLPMKEVGEFHVDGSHGARVLHDPVFVHIRGIVVAGGAGRKRQKKGDVRPVEKTKQKQQHALSRKLKNIVIEARIIREDPI